VEATRQVHLVQERLTHAERENERLHDSEARAQQDADDLAVQLDSARAEVPARPDWPPPLSDTSQLAAARTTVVVEQAATPSAAAVDASRARTDLDVRRTGHTERQWNGD
jgi:hypothetical protein